jgi:predicted RNase H-like HicB family nuclease
MKETTMKTYRVVYEHDDSMWLARVPALQGCHTQGRTIAQARERIREAISLYDPNKVTLTDDIRLPKGVLADLRRIQTVRERQTAVTQELRNVYVRLARKLTQSVGVSLHDAGELLGMSKQRVQQILSA